MRVLMWISRPTLASSRCLRSQEVNLLIQPSFSFSKMTYWVNQQIDLLGVATIDVRHLVAPDVVRLGGMIVLIEVSDLYRRRVFNQ